MKLDASSTKFHAVHRVGKKVQERRRPIIVRFVSREDRNAVWAKGDKIKQSDVHTDAYITEDFARAIQGERKVLMKAMSKARDDLGMDTGAPNDNFRENICSEDDLRSRIFGTFVVKFLACLPLLGFSNI